MLVIEGIFLALFALGGYDSIFGKKTQSSPPMPATSVTSSSNTMISHTTISEGDDATIHYNLYVKNEGIPPLDLNATSISSGRYKNNFGTVRFSDLANTTYQFCYDNKYSIAALTVAGTYGYLFYKIRSIEAYVENPQRWSNWKKDISFERLLAIPQDQLTRDLIMAAQDRYMSPENPIDSLTPLITFSAEIAQEKELLTQYHAYISWSMQFGLPRIIAFPDTLLSQLQERKQRVTFLHTLFQSWLAHYKLEQITR